MQTNCQAATNVESTISGLINTEPAPQRRLQDRLARDRWRIAEPKLPLIPGHEIVGKVLWCGSGRFSVGQRVGIPWLGWTCGQCRFCKRGEENLCERAQSSGYTRDGGYA